MICRKCPLDKKYQIQYVKRNLFKIWMDFCKKRNPETDAKIEGLEK